MHCAQEDDSVMIIVYVIVLPFDRNGTYKVFI
jgi:hypothetical protein